MQLTKRNLVVSHDIPPGGEVVTITNFQPAQTDFYAYELFIVRAKKGEGVIGLQKQSFNINSLIDLLGDDTDVWKGKKVMISPGVWKDIPVIRFSAAKQ